MNLRFAIEHFGRMVEPSRRDRSGQVLVLFMLALTFVLIPAIGLGIDGSRAFEERRAAQTAVDQAAIAATRAACVTGGGDPVAKGTAAAARNGYSNSGLAAETGNTVTLVRPDPVAKPYMYTATINTRIPGTFARMIPGGLFNMFHVTVEATADGANCGASAGGGPGTGPIYAGGASCPGGSLNNIELSGNDHIVNGLTQTNGNFKNSGSRSSFQNPPDPSVKYVGTFTGGDGTNVYNAAPQDINTVPTPQWPAGWGPADMTTAMWDAYAAYYTTHVDGMDIGSIGPGVTSFALVARNGPIKLPTDLSSTELIGRTFTAYNHASQPKQNILILSGFSHSQPCDQFAIEKSGNRGAFYGIMWAPNAMVRWSGNEATLFGCVISHAFQMNGNFHRLNADATLCSSTSGATSPQITLVK
jgi:Flp pilus assembly protein TadG